ncbi:MAG TPA: flagellar hook-associated protein FlgK [Myxococcales bacterium]|nr:flagellar hook-associated protein FlgK [Myxococcales bacterium]
MADLLSILSFSGTSLGAQRGALQTASHNLANAATPGYARQRATLTAAVPGERHGSATLGRGATLSAVTQVRDRFVESQLPAGLSSHARSGAESEALAAVSALDPTSEQGLAAALGGFYSGLRAMAQNPGSLPLREAAAGQTRALALAFNRTASALDAARDGADRRIDGLAAEVNAHAAGVASLNAQIRAARASGEVPNDLLDARQRSLDRLAELAGGVPVPDAEGNVSVALPGGTALVSGDRAGTLSTVADASNGGHLALQLRRADGSGPFALSGAAGGEIGGMLDARDGALRSAEASVDALAFDLASAVNAAHRAGYGLDGVSGRNLLDAGATTSGAASRIALSAAVAADVRAIAAASSTGSPGDATNLQAVIATESQVLSGGDTAAAGLARATAAFGAAAQRAQAAFEAHGAALDQLDALRQSASGVSIDEEMVNMTKAQRAFEAITKVMSTADQMLDTLLKLK